MQPPSSSREMNTMSSLLNQQQQQSQFQMPFDPTSSHDDFLEQMLSSINNPSSPWPDLSNPNPNITSSSSSKPHSPWPDLSGSASIAALKSAGGEDQAAENHQQYHFDDHLLASKLRQQQINSNGGGGGGSAVSAAAAKALMLQQQLMLSRSLTGNGLRSPTGAENGLLQMPLSLGNADQNDVVDGATFKSRNPANDSTVQALYNGFAGSLGQTANQPQHFHHPQAQNFGAPAGPAMNQAPPPSGSTGGGGASGAPAQPRQQRVRARRGQATDPHSIAERLRRERIAERMKALQELVPNANKTDKASMLDEIIDYVKFLQLQVKVLSMSRLGGASAVAPLVADMSSEAGGDGGRANGTQTASSSNNDTMTVTEHQVAKLMEEDMGSAMQYLQGKGLCLMPISLATAISTATCHSRNPMTPTTTTTTTTTTTHPLLGANGADGGGPSSPSLSVLTVQSAAMANGGGEASVKDAASISKS